MTSITDLKRELNDNRSRVFASYDKLITKLESLAYFDELTNVLNRRGILDALNRQIARAKRHDECIIVMMTDLNKFKKINDKLGHDAGDIMLVEVAKRLKETFRTEDRVGRLGGDEFMIICGGKDCCSEASALAKKAIDIFNKPFQHFEQFDVSNSVGVSVFPKHGADSVTLMKCADIAMYVAKDNDIGYHTYTENDKVDNRIKA